MKPSVLIREIRGFKNSTADGSCRNQKVTLKTLLLSPDLMVSKQRLAVIWETQS